MNIIVIGLIVAYTGYSIYKDFTLHEPIGIKVLDILQEVVLVVSGISLFLSFAKFFRTVSPWVMGVILIAGVTLSIVSLFIKRKDPPSPVESFISTILVPFVASLEMPSEQWLDEREVIDKNINPDLLELAMAI